MKYSVVIPIYNELETIPKLISRLGPVCKKLGAYEIICVDDGSNDGSFEALIKEKEKEKNLRVIKFLKNSGQSAAFDAGIKNASGDVIITMDGDLQNPPEEIPLLLEGLKGNDFVIGWRHQRHDNFRKKIASKIANAIRQAFLGDGAQDTGCSLKAFKKEAISQIKLFNGMHRFFPALLVIEGFKYAEVKVSHENRKWGVSKYGTFRRAIPAFIDLLAVLWMRKRKLPYKIEKIY